MLYITLHCITGKIFVEIGPDLGEYSMKTTQNNSKMIATLTFQDL